MNVLLHISVMRQILTSGPKLLHKKVRRKRSCIKQERGFRLHVVGPSNAYVSYAENWEEVSLHNISAQKNY